MQIIQYQKFPASFKPWTTKYLDVAKALIEHIRTSDFAVIHFGSTSAMVGGKGIIDLSVLYQNGQLEQAIAHLKSIGFQDQDSPNPFPPERPRKDGSVVFNGQAYQIHVHVIRSGSDEHKHQLRYREMLLSNSQLREQYEASKRAILSDGVVEQEDYGKRKSPFVKAALAQTQRPE